MLNTEALRDNPAQLHEQALAILREDGLFRDDQLSYTRISYLEWETGIRTGPWEERLRDLFQARWKDQERAGI
jgi:hypothetical protein